MQPFEWVSARSEVEAANAGATTVAAAMAGPTAGRDALVFKAGGIDLLDLMKESLLQPRRLVNLRGIAGLDRIAEEKDGTLRVGALATLAQVAQHPLIRQRYTALAEASQSSASPQIRNVATLGGNLLQRPQCWYFRSAHHHCTRKGGAACFAFAGENQYPPSSTKTVAPWCIPRPPRPRLWHWAPASNWPMARVPGGQS